MLDKKGRLFGKVSVVDLFAVVMVAAIVAVVYFNIGGRAHLNVGAEQPVLITFFNPALHDFTVNAIEIDTPVIDDVNATFLGTVVGVEVGDSISFMPDIHGNEVASPMEGHSSVAITSRVYGRISDGAVVLGGNVYGVGSEVIIWAGRAKTMLHISDVRAE
ncbi:MAG: DUF4330 domain-containing protein [Defluviitaleaceae bacterium]|nr:DUF4330 domain-containing protein [Defluviitaleaceae bacterium]MCL2261820.1 DUF4330 domain-containing protein [Defluviitaleaceae bacterium]